MQRRSRDSRRRAVVLFTVSLRLVGSLNVLGVCTLTLLVVFLLARTLGSATIGVFRSKGHC